MKKAFYTLARPLLSLATLPSLIQRSGQSLLLPFYHSVRGDESLPHIHHLYSLRSLATFEKDLDYLLRHFQAIDLSTLSQHILEKKPFEQASFFLSFDDGLREVHDYIAPLLLRKGIPATFFLNAAFVDNRDLFFRYKASLLVEHFKTTAINPLQKTSLQDLFRSADFPNPVFPAAFLQVKYAQTNLLDAAAELLGLSFVDFLHKKQPYLSSSQIQKLATQGFSFGAHSVDHPLYSDITPTEQLRQSIESLQFVEQHFPTPNPSFAFPFTDDQVALSFFNQLQKTYPNLLSFGTAGLKKDNAPQHLQRFPMEAYALAAQELIPMEYFYYIARSLLGKQTIHRV